MHVLPEGMSTKSTDEMNVIGSPALVESGKIIDEARVLFPDGVAYILVAAERDEDSVKTVIATCFDEDMVTAATMSSVAFSMLGSNNFGAYLYGCMKVVKGLPFKSKVRIAMMALGWRAP